MESTAAAPRVRRKTPRWVRFLGAALLALPLLWGIRRASIGWMDFPRLILRPTLPAPASGGYGVAAIAVSPDGTTVWSGGVLPGAGDGGRTAPPPVVLPICAWDGRTGALRYTLPGHPREVEALACSPDGRRLASGGGDGTVRLWDTRTLRMLWSRPCSTSTLAFSLDGSLLAGDSVVWSASTGLPLRSLVDRRTGFVGTAISPDGRTLARVSSDLDKWVEPDGRQRSPAGGDWHRSVGHRLQLWDIGSGRLLRTLPCEQTESATFSPDGRWIACVADGDDDSYASVVHVVDAATGAPRWRSGKNGEGWCALCLAYSPNGNWLAAEQLDHAVALFDAATGRLVRRLRAYEVPQSGDVTRHSTLAFSRDGKTLVACGGSTVQVWDTGGLR